MSTLVAHARAGRSQVLVLRGEAGIGKSALLDYVAEVSTGCLVAKVFGVEPEMDLAFASLHQLCGQFRSLLDTLPKPQRDALAITFGLQAGEPPDPLMVGLAVLTLLNEVAEQRPLVCVFDDAQWLDHASAQVLQFVARRLRAERVAMVFAVRDSGDEPCLAGFPEMFVEGLDSHDAAALLSSTAMAGQLEAGVYERVLDESHGNPLALRELPRMLHAWELAFVPPEGVQVPAPLSTRLEEGYLRELHALPEQARKFLLLAAADPVGYPPLLWRASERLGISSEAVMTVQATGLLEVREQARFRHPLVRSAVYRAATASQRRQVHHELADATDPYDDPDRHAWHRARAADGPDETVATMLEDSADRAFARGGLAAAAASMEAAASLTPTPALRGQRSLKAAQTKAAIGAFDDARSLLAAAEAGPLDETGLVHVALLRAQIEHISQRGNKGLSLLLDAARRLEPLDSQLARATYLEAVGAAMFAGRLTPGASTGMELVAGAVRAAQLPTDPTRSDALLQEIARIYTEGYQSAGPGLRRVTTAFGTQDLSLDEAVRFAWLAATVAWDMWDDAGWGVLTQRHLEAVRQVGALGVLPLALNSRVVNALVRGDLSEAEDLVAETAWVADITDGQNAMAPYGDAFLSAMHGDVLQAEPAMRLLRQDVIARGEGGGLNLISWVEAMLYNSLGRYEEALDAAQAGAAEPLELGPPKWALGELVEAAVRTGNREVAVSALQKLIYYTTASRTDLALGILAGRTALLRDGPTAEEDYRRAISMLERTTVRLEHTRAQLLYGEWLGRQGRRADARTQLRTAHDSFVAMGFNAFAERARTELAVNGESLRKSTVAVAEDLNLHEAHIARLAARGLTNAEIGAELYISPRTVEWHLRKVFLKLGISTRRQLVHSLPDAFIAHS